MLDEITDLEIVSQLEQLWLKINEGIALANAVLERGKLLGEVVDRKQQEAIAELEARYQEVLKIQSSLPDLHQEFLELGDIKRHLKSLIKDVNRTEDISNLADSIASIRDETNWMRAAEQKLNHKIEELGADIQLLSDRAPAIAERFLQEHSSLSNELKDFYNHAFSNLKRIEDRTLETFDRLTVASESQIAYINNLVAQLENNLQAQENLKTELDARCDRILAAERQLQANLDLVNSELTVQGMKQVEQIHVREELAKDRLTEFADRLTERIGSNLQKESLQQEVAAADRAISQIILQRQELQRELASSSSVIQRLNQVKIDSVNSSLSSASSLTGGSDELLNKLKSIEQKYDRLRQSLWWLGIGIGIASGVAIAFGGFIFR